MTLNLAVSMTSFRVEMALEDSRSTTRKHGLCMFPIIGRTGALWRVVNEITDFGAWDGNGGG